jgi:hypothetical protein
MLAIQLNSDHMFPLSQRQKILQAQFFSLVLSEKKVKVTIGPNK